MQRADPRAERGRGPDNPCQRADSARQVHGVFEFIQRGLIPTAEEAIEEHVDREGGQDADEENQYAGKLIFMPNETRYPAQEEIMNRRGQQGRGQGLPCIKFLREAKSVVDKITDHIFGKQADEVSDDQRVDLEARQQNPCQHHADDLLAKNQRGF